MLTAEIDRKNRMLIPESHQGKTKNSWVSFYNMEAESLLNDYVPMHKDTISHLFYDVSVTTGININPHLLRSVFAREMAKAGVQPQFVDAFCGRIPQSVLARSYTDYSPEVLKEIYLKANIKILGV